MACNFFEMELLGCILNKSRVKQNTTYGKEGSKEDQEHDTEHTLTYMYETY